MTNYHPTDEAPTERLILIELESPERWDTQHRHIIARVVRRAQAHVHAAAPSTYVQHFDGEKVSGYRHATWSKSSPKGAIYVDDLRIRGQIDVNRHDKLNGGMPYGNDVSFACHTIKARDARLMHEAFGKIGKRMEALEKAGHVHTDSFVDSVRMLMLALGINKAVVKVDGAHGTSLGDPDLWHEVGLAGMSYTVSALVRKAHGNSN